MDIDSFKIDYANLTIKIPDLCKKYNIGFWTLLKILKEHNIPKRRKSVKLNFTEEQIQEMVEESNRGVRRADIAKKFGISKTGLARIILAKDGMTLEKRLADKHEKLIAFHDAGKSTRFISDELKMDYRDIKDVLEKNGRSVRPVEFYSRVNTLNEEYFSTIDSFNKAQMLGFIQGDGSVSKIGNHLSLSLVDRDYDWLVWFNKCLESNAPIISYKGHQVYNKKLDKTYQCSPHSCVDVSSKKLLQDLSKFGIIPNKTYMDCPLPSDQIPIEHMNGYFLGFIESDGSVNYREYLTYSKRTKLKDLPTRSFNCIMLSQPTMAIQIVDFFKKHLDIEVKSYPLKGYNNNLHKLIIHKILDMIKLYHFLYDNATFVMKRKHDKFLQIMRYAESRGYNIGTLRSFE